MFQQFLENRIASATNRPGPDRVPNLATAPLTHHKRGPDKPTDSNDNTATLLLSEVKKRKHHRPGTLVTFLNTFFYLFVLISCMQTLADLTFFSSKSF